MLTAVFSTQTAFKNLSWDVDHGYFLETEYSEYCEADDISGNGILHALNVSIKLVKFNLVTSC